MGIVLKTPQQAIERMVEEKAKVIKRRIIEALSMIGEECISIARTQGNYTDQTGNLRSSIGFMIVQDGREVSQQGFEQKKGGSEGVKVGKRVVSEVAKEFPQHSVLIVVAGMNYGIYVERIHNKDVLTSAKLYAKTEAKKIMQDIGLTL